MPEGTTLVELVTVILTAIAPVVGGFIWVVKWMAGRLTESIDNLNATIQSSMTDDAVKEITLENKIDKVIEGQDDIDDSLKTLVDQHKPGHALCRFNDVEADMLTRSAKKGLQANGG